MALPRYRLASLTKEEEEDERSQGEREKGGRIKERRARLTDVMPRSA